LLRAAHLDGATVVIETYPAREQGDDLHRRGRGLEDEAVRQTESEWSEPIAMLELARRWQELLCEFTLGSPTPMAPTRMTSARRHRAATTSNANKSAGEQHGLPILNDLAAVRRC
jgi:hypothetical protein